MVTIGVRGKGAEGAEGSVKFGAVWGARLLCGLSRLGFPVGGAV